MNAVSRILAASAAASLAAACAAPSAVYYEPPAGLTAGQAVSVLGSKDPKFLLQSSEYRLVWAVDGKLVKNSAYRWDQPLLISADEPHRLSLGYGWGATTGWTDVTVIGKPGTTVVVKAEDVDPDRLARMWLEDGSTGQVIGEKMPVQLVYGYAPPMPTVVDTEVIPIQATRLRH
ncbi:MAG TPA: hypothetical protein VGU20_00445 [Stellaceae bacterium]|nr:hypothetical protein [Stellaceae bacterium]